MTFKENLLNCKKGEQKKYYILSALYMGHMEFLGKRMHHIFPVTYRT